MSVPTIPAQRLRELYAAGRPVDLIDVRTPAEFRTAHVAFARNLPLDRLDPADVLRSGAGRPDRPLYVLCQSGARGRQACERLIAAGGADVRNVEGGIPACVDADLPIVRGQKAMSLDRQVRITAGLLVLTGVALGVFAHPGFVALSGFVGAGLVFSGVTDTCGMGLLLARMPWNRGRIADRACAAP